MKENNFDFERLKHELKDLTFKEQLIRLIKERTEYLQNINPSQIDFITQVPFDKKCNLEIEKIKEIMKINAL